MKKKTKIKNNLIISPNSPTTSLACSSVPNISTNESISITLKMRDDIKKMKWLGLIFVVA